MSHRTPEELLRLTFGFDGGPSEIDGMPIYKVGQAVIKINSSGKESAMTFRKVERCRVCGSSSLQTILHLGEQAYTGVFPASHTVPVPTAPLELAFCTKCALSQLHHQFDPSMMYGPTYGYRSGLNKSMVKHLENKVRCLESRLALAKGDWVLDIGSNDGTTLSSYLVPGLHCVGIDPTASKFREFYTPSTIVVEDFFSAERYFSVADQQAKLVTSIAMFYDLEDPVAFADQVRQVLHKDGIWHFEQSYLPAMLRRNSFDTICHEHVMYYSLHNIEQILGKAGLRVLDVHFNEINGGSFAVTAGHLDSRYPENRPVIEWTREMEQRLGIHTETPLVAFAKRIQVLVPVLVDLLERLASANRTVFGYGASTKGNVLLQYAGIDQRLLQAIGEVNLEKIGCVTPGSHIPIISDAEARRRNPHYFLVLPWHFRGDILLREQEFLIHGGHFIFPLPEPEVV